MTVRGGAHSLHPRRSLSVRSSSPSLPLTPRPSPSNTHLVSAREGRAKPRPWAASRERREEGDGEAGYDRGSRVSEENVDPRSCRIPPPSGGFTVLGSYVPFVPWSAHRYALRSRLRRVVSESSEGMSAGKGSQGRREPKEPSERPWIGN